MNEATTTLPIANAYWVYPRRLLAGEYPTLLDTIERPSAIARFLAAGIATFINLTEAEEVEALGSYVETARALAAERTPPISYHHFPIPDMDVPPIATMTTILDTIDGALLEQRPVYVHCWGGIGRTGTVVGCHLVRHGMAPTDVIAHIAHLRRNTPDYRYPAPARDVQRAMILAWRQGQ